MENSFYKIKDSSYKLWIDLYENHKDICTLQEFLEYMIKVPTSVFSEYFDKNKINYKKDFEPNVKDFANIKTQIILRNYGKIDILKINKSKKKCNKNK